MNSNEILSIILCGAIGYFIFSGVFDYKPFYEYSNEVVDGHEDFMILEDNEFSGYAYYDKEQNHVLLQFVNSGKDVRDFTNAKYKVILKSNKTYGLELLKFENHDYDDPIKNYQLNPELVFGATVECVVPGSLGRALMQDKIKGILINLQDGRNIRFGYQKYSLWRKTCRYFIKTIFNKQHYGYSS